MAPLGGAGAKLAAAPQNNEKISFYECKNLIFLAKILKILNIFIPCELLAFCPLLLRFSRYATGSFVL